MMKKLLELKTELDSGIWPSIHARQIPVWEDGRNIEFGPGHVSKIRGYTAPFVYSAGKPIRGLGQQRLENLTQRMYWGTINALFKWDVLGVEQLGSGYTGQTNATATSPATVWSFESWGNWMLATNGRDAPQIYKNTGSFEALAGFPANSAEIFIRRGPHMLAFGLAGSSQTFAWCSDDNIEDWTSTQDNTAGALFMREMDSPPVAVVPMGDLVAVYSQDSLFLVSYVGAPLVFGYKPALNGIGAVGKQAVVPVGRRNFGFGRQGFWVTDGVSHQYIDDPMVRKYWQSRINWAQASKVSAYHHEDSHQIRWFLPTNSGEPDFGLAFDYIRNVWSPLDYGRSSAVERQVFNYPIVATPTGEIYFDNFGWDADGEALNAWIQTKPQDMGEPSIAKFVTSIQTGITNYVPGSIQVSVGTQMRLTDPIVWTPPTVITEAYAPVYVRCTGRWISFKYEWLGAGSAGDLNVIEVFGNLVGKVI